MRLSPAQLQTPAAGRRIAGWARPLAVAAALTIGPGLAMAQVAPAVPPAAAPPAAAPPAATPSAVPAAPRPDTVVAKVGDQTITLAELSEAAQALPDEVRSMPPQVLYPMLLDQMVDREALVIQARKDGLQNDATVKAAIARATDQVLQNAILSREIGPSVSEGALRARYDATIANAPGEEEVHALHILVPTEAEAKAVIEQLNRGADFATLAKTASKDPAAQNGGDLGFFKKADMVPEFAEAAFALKVGEYTKTPIKTQFGWHVIKVVERHMAPPPTFEQSHDELRQQIIQAGVRAAVEKARVGLVVQKFNMDGSPMTPAAVTPPAPGTPTTDIPPTPGAPPGVVPGAPPAVTR